MSRLGSLNDSLLTREQRKLRSAMVSGPRGSSAASGGPFEVWLHSPKFGNQVQKFGAYVRYSTSLARCHSELAVLVCARYWGADYEWYAHAAIAEEAGVSTEAVEAIRTGKKEGLLDEASNAIFDFCYELLSRHRVSEPIYDAAEHHLGKVALIELVGVVGYYSLVALTLNAFEIQTPDGSRPLSGLVSKLAHPSYD